MEAAEPAEQQPFTPTLLVRRVKREETKGLNGWWNLQGKPGKANAKAIERDDRHGGAVADCLRGSGSYACTEDMPADRASRAIVKL